MGSQRGQRFTWIMNLLSGWMLRTKGFLSMVHGVKVTRGMMGFLSKGTQSLRNIQILRKWRRNKILGQDTGNNSSAKL